jgi:alpha-tubulin suppressor-like RCC1 family protein
MYRSRGALMRLRHFPVPLNPSSVVIISKALSARSFLFTSITAVALGLLAFLPQAAAQQASALGLPVLSVLGGTFTTQQQVITTTPDAGVTLRYTVNGNTPTGSDPVVAPGGSVLITQSGTLKVAGFAGAAVGPVATASFTITGQVSAGAQSSAVLKSDGTVWTSGDNSYGQLGTGNLKGSAAPTQVPGLSGCTAVSSGYYHVLALRRDGTVWTWGHNGDGQLGTGTNLNMNAVPEQVTSLTDVVALAAGGYHSLALKSDGTVWAWGNNNYGGLGLGNGTACSIPVQIPSLSAVRAISAGYFHSLALKSDGTVWAFGYNANGELAVGSAANSLLPQKISSLTSVVGFAAGRFHSVFLRSDGTVWTSGANAQGQLGNNSTVNSSVPVQVSGLSGVVSVGAGFFFSSALKGAGTVFSWGANTQQELGNGASANSPVPVQVLTVGSAIGISSQGYHSLAALTNGGVYAWGSNFCGDFGNGVSSTKVAPEAVPGMSNVKSFAGGPGFSFALKNDGTVWTWGNNPNGELGNGTQASTSAPAPLSTLSGIAQVAAGGFHGVALKSDGTVWTWGYNGYCELGNGTQTNSLSPIQVGISGVTAVAAGAAHTLALRSDGTVWGWGYSVNGELGTGVAGYYYAYPTQVPALTGVVAISAGYFHSLALKSDGTVWACGLNSSGQLGTGNTANSLVPVKVGSLSGITSIASGYFHNLAVRGSDATVWAWGSNPNGELGNGSTNASAVPLQVAGLNKVTGVSAGAYHSHAIASGISYGWGANFLGGLGNGLNLENRLTPSPVVNSSAIPLTKLAGGDYHSLGLSSSGVLYSWGSNFTGQLGLGYIGATPSPVPSNFVAVALNQTPPAPTNLMVNYNGATQATLTWSQSGSVTQSFTIQQSTDGGLTWTTVGTAAGNLNSYVVNGLPVGSNPKFRVVANGTYTSSAPTAAASSLVALQVTGTAIAPATLTLTATVSAAAGPVAKVNVYEGNSLLGSFATGQANPPYTITVPAVNAGQHTYSVVISNASGVVMGQGSAAVTVLLPPDPLANFRFARGPVSEGSDLAYQTYVLSVDKLRGVGLDPLGNNASKFPLGLPWFACITGGTLYQVANTNPVTYPTAYQNPVAAYGSVGGGTPLYVKQSYRFAFGSGTQVNTVNYLDFRVSVYAKSQFTPGRMNVAPVKVYTLSLPRPSDTAGWNAFAQSGFVKTYDFTADGYPLVTKVEFIAGATYNDPLGKPVSAPFLLTHTAGNSNFYYRIDYAGTTQVNGAAVPMNISVPATSPTYGYGYTLDFSDRAPWVSTFLSTPQFDGVALPSEYAGKSVNELLKVSSPVTYQFAAPGAAYTALDASPELRSHPILDKLVNDLGANPVMLTNFVINQIQLTDALSYNETGAVNESSINPGGVNRSAVGTFLEKQGSPTEQCALLVYLLRKAGVPSGYVFPTPNTLQMLDSRMSRLLRMQLKGASNPYSMTTVPQLLNVNYPWVAVYINGQWVHVFPWMKDTFIDEGYNITDCLPSGYQTGLQWLQKYISRDSSILSQSAEFDNPGKLYPLWLTQQLGLKGLTTSDVGVTVFDRQNNYASWSEFPQPWQVTPGSLGAANLKDSLSAMVNIFDTIQCVVYSDRNNNGQWDSGEPMLDSGTLRAVDLHNRTVMVRAVKTGVNAHTLTLSLEPLRPGTAVTEAFPPNGALINKQAISTALTSSDEALNFRTVYNRHRSLPSGFTIPNPLSTFLGVTDTTRIMDERPLRKGDTAVLCLNFGRVTQEMLNVQAQKFWSAQQTAAVSGRLKCTTSGRINRIQSVPPLRGGNCSN